jgi:AcrR family transcriptional regulator
VIKRPAKGRARKRFHAAPTLRGGAKTGPVDVKTRARLLEAALELFSERGFDDVTVRQISSAAGANLAAVSYHFGDKLGLYEAVVRDAIEDMRKVSDLSMDAGARSTAQEKLRHYVRVYLPRIAKPKGRAARIQKLVRHEMSRSTPLGPQIAEAVITPRVQFMTALMSELLGCGEDDPRVRLCVTSLQAQCLFYMHDPMRAKFFPDWPPRSDAELNAAAEHVAAFSLAGIAAIKRKTR